MSYLYNKVIVVFSFCIKCFIIGVTIYDKGGHTMDIDDIYFSAIEGRVDDLKRMLNTDEGKRILNIPVETTSDGIKMRFSVLLSILSSMAEKEFNFEVLDVLAEAGIDVNVPVELVYPTGLADVYPLAKLHLKEPRVLEWLLMNGANPNAVEYVESENKMVETVSLLVWAIKDNAEVGVQLLLIYGADPSMPARPYRQGTSRLQKIPPLYYSLMETHNPKVTALLYNAGAYTDEHADFTKKYGGYGTLGSFVERDRTASQVHSQAFGMKDTLPKYNTRHLYDASKEENAIESSTVVKVKTLARINQENALAEMNAEIRKDNDKAASPFRRFFGK